MLVDFQYCWRYECRLWSKDGESVWATLLLYLEIIARKYKKSFFLINFNLFGPLSITGRPCEYSDPQYVLIMMNESLTPPFICIKYIPWRNLTWQNFCILLYIIYLYPRPYRAVKSNKEHFFKEGIERKNYYYQFW